MDHNEWEELNDIENVIDQEKLESNKASQDTWSQDPFTALMFGSPTTIRQTGTYSPNQQQETIKDSHNYIDLDELMVHIDTLYSSYQELKPIFQKIYPFIEQFLKKK
ncbi:hypothetical protein [Neobacillus sp. LXY-1]|uniref:hypothetical protein n=1 Tax=Neobacillus sp. LXY-1 TaxID=3379133 RepID=UPI003EDF15BD